jgi:hypothetical protein
MAGPSQSGKTHLLCQLLLNRNDMFSNPFDRIVWCYSQWQPSYAEISKKLPQIQWVEGLPSDLYDSFTPSMHNLLIADDLMGDDDTLISKIFTKGSHHLNLTIVYLLQNLFVQGKEARNISLNAHYIFLFKNPRENSQVGYLARQMYPRNSKFMQSAYDDATKSAHSYLLVDCRQDTHDNHRLRTSILPYDQQYVYLPSENGSKR